MAPSAEPAPQMVCSSSMNRITSPAARTSLSMERTRSSNSPRYLVPATMPARLRETTRLPSRQAGACPSAIRWTRPSTRAVLPTPAGPSSTGLLFCRRDRICMIRRISPSRQATGSYPPAMARAVMSSPNCRVSFSSLRALFRAGPERSCSLRRRASPWGPHRHRMSAPGPAGSCSSASSSHRAVMMPWGAASAAACWMTAAPCSVRAVGASRSCCRSIRRTTTSSACRARAPSSSCRAPSSRCSGPMAPWPSRFAA